MSEFGYKWRVALGLQIEPSFWGRETVNMYKPVGRYTLVVKNELGASVRGK